MCLGYALGFVFVQEPARRNRTLLKIALGAIVLFMVLRAINGYGDRRRGNPFRASHMCYIYM
jgi:hypothetical protein